MVVPRPFFVNGGNFHSEEQIRRRTKVVAGEILKCRCWAEKMVAFRGRRGGKGFEVTWFVMLEDPFKFCSDQGALGYFTTGAAARRLDPS